MKITRTISVVVAILLVFSTFSNALAYDDVKLEGSDLVVYRVPETPEPKEIKRYKNAIEDDSFVNLQPSKIRQIIESGEPYITENDSNELVSISFWSFPIESRYKTMEKKYSYDGVKMLVEDVTNDKGNQEDWWKEWIMRIIPMLLFMIFSLTTKSNSKLMTYLAVCLSAVWLESYLASTTSIFNYNSLILVFIIHLALIVIWGALINGAPGGFCGFWLALTLLPISKYTSHAGYINSGVNHYLFQLFCMIISSIVLGSLIRAMIKKNIKQEEVET